MTQLQLTQYIAYGALLVFIGVCAYLHIFPTDTINLMLSLTIGHFFGATPMSISPQIKNPPQNSPEKS